MLSCQQFAAVDRPRPQAPLYHSLKMADDSFENFLSSLNFTMYLERFKDTGYDDIDLLIDATDEELNQMFDIVTMSTKPGHVLKFKKSLANLKTARTIKSAAYRADLGGTVPKLLTKKDLNLQAASIQKPQQCQDTQMKRQKSKLKVSHFTHLMFNIVY